jgi:hypothetical protein
MRPLVLQRHARWIGRSAGDANHSHGFAGNSNIEQGTARSTI